MSIAQTTEARDQAAKELNTGAGKSKKKLIGGAGGNKSADAPPERKIADGKKQAAAKKAAMKSKPLSRKRPTPAGYPPPKRNSPKAESLPPTKRPLLQRTVRANPHRPPDRPRLMPGRRPPNDPPGDANTSPVRARKAPVTAPDDAKSLSWMATQAVKALDAVKASQLEQALALKASAENSQGEQALAWEDDGTTLDAGEPAGIPGEFIQTLAASRGGCQAM